MMSSALAMIPITAMIMAAPVFSSLDDELDGGIAIWFAGVWLVWESTESPYSLLSRGLLVWEVGISTVSVEGAAESLGLLSTVCDTNPALRLPRRRNHRHRRRG